jgi:hypothetical protein
MSALPQRPHAPEHLNEQEAAAWSQIVSGMPSNWFRAGSLPILESLTVHIRLCRELERRLRDDGLSFSDQTLLEFLKAYDRETRLVMALSRSLRLTPQSRYTPGHAATVVSAQPPVRPPWEL